MPSQWSLLLHVRRRKFRRLVFSCRCASHRHGFFSTWLPPAPVTAGSPRKSGPPLILSLRSTPPRILLHLASSCSCCRGLAAQVGLALNPVAALHTARILLHRASSCSCCRGLAAQVGLALNPVAALHTATDSSPPGFLLLLLPRARRFKHGFATRRLCVRACPRQKACRRPRA